MRRALERLRALIGGRQLPDSSPPAAAAPATSARLGQWQLEREVAHGAMGVVWLAHDVAGGPLVAIKTVPLRQDESGDAFERFRREVRATQRLQHPDIVRVLDSGQTPELAWLAMEWVRGRDLAHYTLPARRLPIPVVLRIGARVARALAHAHERGVVHRDVKPANVLVDIGSDVVKVTDFGIAHLSDSSRTRSGLVLGTPSYTAPEQLTGRQVDARADLYALGVTLFHLLSGRLPHEADSMSRLLAAIVNEPAPLLNDLCPDVPAATAEVIARALEKQPERRHASGTALAEDLEALLSLAEPQTSDPWTGPPAPSSAPSEASPGRDDPGQNAGRQ